MPTTQVSVVPDGGNGKRTNSSSSSSSCCASSCFGGCLIVLGILVALAGIAYGGLFPGMINKKLVESLAKCKASDYIGDNYTDPYGDCETCNPSYTSVYFFNITNAETFLSGADPTTKLAVQELGPYAFRKRNIKLDVDFSLEDDQVTYYDYSYYTYDQEKSCATCLPTDRINSFDLSVIGLLSANGGEASFLSRMLKSGGVPDAYLSQIMAAIGPKVMQVFYGYNSMNPETLKALGGNMSYLLLYSGMQPPQLLAALPPTTGPDFHGVISSHTVLELALGHGSFFIGMVLGGLYVKQCSPNSATKLSQVCDACRKANNCPTDLLSTCVLCDKGAAVLAANEVLCPVLKASYAEVFDEAQATQFAASTCQNCAVTGMCIAPVAGPLGSGIPWSEETAPTSDELQPSILKAGCTDKHQIGDYVQYKGATSFPVGVQLDTRRNPTLLELIGTDRSCATNPKAVCSQVSGGDMSSFYYGGLTAKQVAQDVPLEERDVWISSLYQAVTVHNTHEKHTIEGIDMIRFTSADDALSFKDSNAGKGTGVPVDGLQELSWVTGFLMYMAFPMFIHGDDSLLTAIDITLNDSTKATKETLYDSDGKLKAEYFDRFATYLDVEPATGKAMNGRGRLMVNTAISKSPMNPLLSFMEQTAPKLQTEVVFPLYWVEEAPTVSHTNAQRFTKIVALVKTFVPALVVLVLVGLVLIVIGCCNRRRAKHGVVPR